MKWPSVPLEQLILESKDGEWGEATEKSGYILCNIIRGTDFRNTSNTNIKFPQRYIKQHLADRKRLQPFDLLIETAGGTATQSTGKTVLVKESLLSGSGTPFLCSSFARYIRLKKDGINPQFLQYFLEALYKNDYMRVYNTQHTGISRFQWSDFKKRTTIPLPPAPIQVNIAAILSAYDDLIENNNRRIAILEKIAEEIYKEWFVRMRFPGHDKVKFHKGIPGGWKLRKLGELIKTQYGFTASSDEKEIGPKFLRITDIAQERINWNSVPYCKIDEKEVGKYVLKEGDILVARTGATVGYAKKINKLHPRSVFASFLVRLKPLRVIDSLSLGIAVESSIFREFIKLFMTGAAQPQANAQIMGLFPLLHPSDDLLVEFNRIIEPILDFKEKLDITTMLLVNSRDLLLSRLITGKLSVEDLDIKFPPSMRSPELVEGREADG